ncbi:Rnase E [Gordonia phage Sour]|uniref:Helix-turn-helix DNA binding protein n=1 Tax=Gordonia phage Sour TaxID=2182349 RepID=A0A2U8UKV7_9CAUD|nr:Rnase E [Gordonia phage Sour]AWN04265.1 helix-turn-helix DNA binding protein [Gordonia phage Sour]
MTEIDERGNPRPTADEIAEAARPEDETIFERRMKSLTLRNGGATYTQIAERMGVSVPTARKDVRLALREIVNEPAEDMIARQRAVLHDLHRAHFARALTGDIESTRMVFEGLKLEAQLFGLNAPQRVAVGVTDMEFAEQAAELIAGLDRMPHAEMLASLDPETRAHLGLPGSSPTSAAPETIEGEVVPENPTPADEPWADV